MRSFDQRQHSYLGYALRIEGKSEDDEREFTVGIGKAAQARHEFQAGMIISGECSPVADAHTEAVEFYKASKLKVLSAAAAEDENPPPWLGIPPELEVYRERGHRRLAANTYDVECRRCIWGCQMAVDMIIDQWNPSQKRYRQETFCYGPLSCLVYSPGPTRKVPGGKGMSWIEEDWVYEESTRHRGSDE